MEVSRSVRTGARATVHRGKIEATVNRELIADSCFNKNQSNSNRTRTADNSSCTGSPLAAPSNSDNNSPRSPQPSRPSHRSQPGRDSHFGQHPPSVHSCPPTLIPPLAAGKCKFRFRSRAAQTGQIPLQDRIGSPSGRNQAAFAIAGMLLFQQSATIIHAPSRRHTFTYFPRSATVVPSPCRIARV